MLQNGLVRLAIFIGLIFAAVACYSMGIKSGAFLLVVIGFLIEGAAWMAIFSRRKSKQ
jgi:ABC-type bacteriocin/lantibiotic exporter with double-glycine peptidase domain